MQFDVDGTGAREALASAYTLVIYEQEFGSSLIKDVYGKVDLAQGGTQVVTAGLVEEAIRGAYGRQLPKGVRDAIERAFPMTVTTEVDYTHENWEADLRALWAMFRCARAAGRTQVDVPPFDEWLRSLGPVDMWAVSEFVVGACNRELFRPAAQAAPEA